MFISLIQTTMFLLFMMVKSIRLKMLLVKPIQMSVLQSLQINKTVIIQSLGIFYLMLIIESTILALLVLVFIPCLEKNFQFEGNVNLSMFIHFEIQSFIKVAGLENIIKNISLYATSLVWKLCQFA